MIRRSLTMALLALMACSEQEFLLEGERLDVRGNPVPAETVNKALPLALPPAVRNSEWTHSGGNTRHQLSHASVGSSLQVAWSASIGQGNDRKHRITADPVVANGRIFTLDSRSRLSAFSTSGAELWAVDLTPASDRAEEGSGGGLAAVGNRVYATNGFGSLTVLNASDGTVIWRQEFDAGATAPPMVRDGVVYAVTSNATGWALSDENGRVLWQVFGAINNRAGTGGPSPLSAGPLVVFPFSSGQMVATVAGTGGQAWAASVAGQRPGRAVASFTDLGGAPIFGDGRIFAGSYAGRAGAFDATTGQQIWSADEGAAGPIWLAGGSLFFVSDRNQLLRLDAATGETIWARDLPLFTRERIRRRKAIFAHHGPLLANGRLILTSDDGLLRQFDPASGELVGSVQLPDGAARNPVAAGGTLYVVAENGQLYALR